MKLATFKNDSPDGELFVVSNDLNVAVSAKDITPNMQKEIIMIQEKFDQMIVLLTKMIDLIDDEYWQKNLSNARSHLQVLDMNDWENVRVAANVVMGMFGGMGSLNDSFISDEFDECADRLYILAVEVKFAAYQGFSEQARKDSGDE